MNMPSLCLSKHHHSVGLLVCCQGKKDRSPNENIPLLLDHDEVHAPAWVFAGERVGYEVQEYVREKAAGLQK